MVSHPPASAPNATADPVPTAESSGFRPELQALRALAVIAVVAYHLWPKHVTGGFVGVDVFFVLSGYLITAHLLREVQASGRVSVPRFWARRIRRLLPAAFTVLAASGLATILFLPQSVWTESLTEIRASALYVENWLLAFNSVDYLAAQNDPSIAQHFWSLSVEEQFYIVWPVLFIAAVWLAVRRGWSRLAGVRFAIIAVVAVSLALSIYLSYTSPGPAYFVTVTRAWEFATGGLLAAFPLLGVRLAPRIALRTVLSWVGMGMVVLSVFVLTGASVFPGWLALLPVVGTLLVIVAGQIDHPTAPTFYGRLAPVQWIGNVSYSIYLWHWPVLIVATELAGRMTLTARIAVIAVTLVLAYLTKRYIEDPVRTRAFWTTGLRPAYTLLVVGMAVLVVATTAGIGALATRQAALDAEAVQFSQCLGAASLKPAAECDGVIPQDALYPALASLADDTDLQYDCYIPKGDPIESCTYGDRDAKTSIAIVGDSHAASLVPGLVAAAADNDWSITIFAGNGCRLGYPDKCAAGPAIDEAVVDGDFDMVLVTGLRTYQPEVDSLVATWSGLIDRGVTIVPVVDVPSFAESTRQCVDDSNGVYSDAAACSTDRDDALQTEPDHFGPAGEQLGLNVLDLTDVFCGVDECPAVIGHVLVYRDAASHVTSTFSASLGWVLEQRLAGIIP